jgi:predicted esterase
MIPVQFSSSNSLVKGYFFPADNGHADSVSITAIFLQGFPGVEGDELLCEQLSQAGINVLTFNYRGTFQSQGYFSFPNAVADIGAALRFVQEPHNLATYHINPERIILGGWSFGAAIAPAGAVQNPAFKKMFMISGRNFGQEARKIAGDPAYAQQVAQNLEPLRAPKGPVHFQDDLIPDLIAYQAALDHEKLAPLLHGRHVLLIGGQQDEVTPIAAHTIPFYRALTNSGADARLEVVPDDHEFSASKEQIIQIILNWLAGN